MKTSIIAHYAELAALSYQPTPIAVSELGAIGYRAVPIHADESERDEGFILTKGSRMLIVIRGSDDIADWVTTNLQLWRDWRGHTGFASAAAHIWARIRPTVELYRQYHPDHPPITVIGHSRGGAVGLHLAQTIKTADIPVELCSFGSPRAASIDWVRQANFTHCRVVHRRDLIPHLPPRILGYEHHGAVYVIDDDAPPEFGRGAWERVCLSIGDYGDVRGLLRGDWLTAHRSYAVSLSKKEVCNA